MRINVIDRNQVLDSFVALAREQGHDVREYDADCTKVDPADVLVTWDDDKQYCALKGKATWFCMQHGFWVGTDYMNGREQLADHYLVYSPLELSIFKKATVVGYPWWETASVPVAVPPKFMLYIPSHGENQKPTDVPDKNFLANAIAKSKHRGIPLIVKEVLTGYPRGDYILVGSNHRLDRTRLGRTLWLMEHATEVYIPVEQSATKMLELMPIREWYRKERPVAHKILEAIKWACPNQ